MHVAHTRANRHAFETGRWRSRKGESLIETGMPLRQAGGGAEKERV